MTGTADVLTTHTADLPPELRAASRALLLDVFPDLTDEDWEHCLGGVHAVVLDDDRVLAHAAVVQRRLLHGGQTLRAGYVEGVAVRAEHRGRGYGAAVMDAVEDVCRHAFPVAALASTDEALGFYAARGWHRWRGPTSALTPQGLVPTPQDDDCVLVLQYGTMLDLEAEITCDWREGDLW